MSRSQALLDTILVISVCAAYVLLEALHVPKRWSFLAMGLALAAFAAYLARRRTDSWHALGFRTDNLKAGLLPTIAITLVGAAGLVGFGIWGGRTAWGPQALLLLGLYPIWALAQQFAFQGVLHRRLMVLIRPGILHVFVTAIAFASVHFGNRVLFALTFVAGIVWSTLYRRWPNLWLLAGSHSVLAALAYPLVLAYAPLSRF
jgi:hypothetical protein